MSASEMTNEELAKELEEAAKLYECEDSEHEHEELAILIEAALRLRNMTVHSDSGAVIAELQRCLKVAEDALKWSLCDISEELRKTRRKVKDVLVEIHRNMPKKTAECVQSAVHSSVHEEDNSDGFWPLPTTKEGAGDGK